MLYFITDLMFLLMQVIPECILFNNLFFVKGKVDHLGAGGKNPFNQLRYTICIIFKVLVNIFC
jgi:hypothetical protein